MLSGPIEETTGMSKLAPGNMMELLKDWIPLHSLGKELSTLETKCRKHLYLWYSIFSADSTKAPRKTLLWLHYSLPVTKLHAT